VGGMGTYSEKTGPLQQVFRVLVLCVPAFLVFQLISLYLSWQRQLILGVASILLGLLVNRVSRSRTITIALMLLSMTATLRYCWWRVSLLIDYFSDESNNRGLIDSTFLLVLISAEAYTVVIMFLGYMQTAWPLQRKPVSMPGDESQWPHVDVLIPTYNEPLSLVRYTALAAINIDYPPDKLHVYILDDGTRNDFLEFAAQAGVGYITRKEHGHAKAGNINHALTTMHSPYVAIFDCDHLPTRSFLQMTLGWMLADPKLGMLQTPHHFYSPDPFERNLLQYKTIPNEGELFYGIVQDGNDFWNATFFCGSCALLRRAVLDVVGGIATETVTEDAHTSLRMQKKGFNTAYINIPQAAGLATETLSAHVGQRIRWARGMIQILRTDNPLFGGKLKFTQRLCYFNAMAHFLYAVPRLVFLGAPLVYLLLGRTIIPGYWLAILVYALPHLVMSSMTNSRIQGRHRHSFWNEIYETVLAPYILAPTLLALVNPKLGKFNVTDKGNTLALTQFDSKISRPTQGIIALNVLGMAVGLYRLVFVGTDHPGAVIMNLVWVVFNMVILGVAAAVAHEQKQRRTSVRIEAKIPVCIRLPDGTEVKGTSIDMSVGGGSIMPAEEYPFSVGASLRLAFPEQTGGGDIGAHVVGVKSGEIRLSFSMPTVFEQEILTKALYSRADAWLSSIESKELDRPLVSLARVIRLSFYGYQQIIRSLFPKMPEPVPIGSASTAALILLAIALGAYSQMVQAAPAAPFHSSTSQASRSGNSPSEPTTQPANTMAPQTLTFKDMGLLSPIEMRGPHSFYSLRFTLSYMMLPKQATLQVAYRLAPGLDPHGASLKVLVNGFAAATLPSSPAGGSADGLLTAVVSIPGSVLVRSNVLTFEFTGSRVMEREDQSGRQVLATIATDSTLEVSGDRIPWSGDLAQLPLPIFDTELQMTTTIPFVFLAPPSAKTLEAAGIVASWLGLQASTRPVRFTVAMGSVPAGNAIVFSSGPSLLLNSLRADGHGPRNGGPTVALSPNLSDPNGSVLVLSGDDEDQLLTAARTLSLTHGDVQGGPPGNPLFSGATARLPDLLLPPARGLDDAPRWLARKRATPLTSCGTRDQMQSDGSNSIPVYFHVPPGLFYGEREKIAMHVRYRYNALQAAKGSALRVIVNGVLTGEIPLQAGTDSHDGERTIQVPVAVIQPFGNTVLFNFDFIPANRPGSSPEAEALKGEILCDSSLDMQRFGIWTEMPDLEPFANAGFPFTRRADLAETTVVLPDQPSADEIALYLHLMSHFGAQTGYPALRVTVSGPNAVMSNAQDYLVLGTIANQPAFAALGALLPVTLNANGLHVNHMPWNLGALENSIARRSKRLLGIDRNRELHAEDAGLSDALIEEIESPSSPKRSVVMIALQNDGTANAFAAVFLNRSQTRDIAGTVSLLRSGAFESYSIDGARYHLGDLSWYGQMRAWFLSYYLLLLLVVTAVSLLAALWIRNWLMRHAQERLKVAEPPDTEI
jgi:cellulose synthase (UDP-forming)